MKHSVCVHFILKSVLRPTHNFILIKSILILVFVLQIRRSRLNTLTIMLSFFFYVTRCWIAKKEMNMNIFVRLALCIFFFSRRNFAHMRRNIFLCLTSEFFIHDFSLCRLLLQRTFFRCCLECSLIPLLLLSLLFYR